MKKYLLIPAVLVSLVSTAHGQLKPITSVAAPATDECRDFVGFTNEQKIDKRYVGGDYGPLDPFATDGIMVLKHGQKVYEWYDGLVDQNTPHILWSASKDVTVTLLARTIQEGRTYQGKKVSLDSHLNEFFPRPPILIKHPEYAEKYNTITLRNLVEMSSGFDWKEYYDEDLSNSDFMPMLYKDGRKDMAQFALSSNMAKEGPGVIWNYSGGNMNIIMATLRLIWGDEYASMPNKLLFSPLGMTGARIERDKVGTFVGSSYVYMTVTDMAKLGQLFLQNGSWMVDENGVKVRKQLLPTDWISEGQKISPPVYNEATTLDIIKKNGTEGSRVFWLNKDIYREDEQINPGVDPLTGQTRIDPRTGQPGRQILYPREMPQAPTDMFFAAGHYGQLIIVIPSQDMVIVRTGYNLRYWAHIQPLAVKALACFNGYKPNFTANGINLVPPSADPKPNFFGRVGNALDNLSSGLDIAKYLHESGLGPAYIAKELCSFLYVSNYAKKLGRDQYLKAYMDRSGLPSILQGWVLAGLNPDFSIPNRVTLTYTEDVHDPIDPAHSKATLTIASAVVDPQVACQIDNEKSGCILETVNNYQDDPNHPENEGIFVDKIQFPKAPSCQK